MTISLNDALKSFLTDNSLSVTEENGSYTLHYINHSCGDLSEKEVKYIISQYLSGKYCSYKPVLSSNTNMPHDD